MEHITLITEEDSRAEMQLKIEATTIGKKRGSVDQGYVLVYFHANMSGESATQPWARRPAVAGSVVKNLLAPLLASRGGDSIHEGDLIVLCDGGKLGLEHALLGAVCNPETGKALAKVKKTLYITKTEEAAGVNKELTRGTATVNQLEALHMLTHSAHRTQKKKRVKMDGSTAGTLIGPVGLSECSWQTTFGLKRVMYGPQKRPLPGGAADADMETPSAKRVVRKDEDTEPFTYWPVSDDLLRELLHYDVISVIDLTPGDGSFARLCATQKIPYLGIAFTTAHQHGLARHIKEGIFKSYCDTDAEDYDAALAEIINVENSGTTATSSRTTRAKRGKARAKTQTKSKSALLKRLQTLQGSLGDDNQGDEGSEEEEEKAEESDDENE